MWANSVIGTDRPKLERPSRCFHCGGGALHEPDPNCRVCSAQPWDPAVIAARGECGDVICESDDRSVELPDPTWPAVAIEVWRVIPSVGWWYVEDTFQARLGALVGPLAPHPTVAVREFRKALELFLVDARACLDCGAQLSVGRSALQQSRCRCFLGCGAFFRVSLGESWHPVKIGAQRIKGSNVQISIGGVKLDGDALFVPPMPPVRRVANTDGPIRGKHIDAFIIDDPIRTDADEGRADRVREFVSGLDPASVEHALTQRDHARRAAKRTLDRMARGPKKTLNEPRICPELSSKKWTPKQAPIRALTWRGDVLFVQHVAGQQGGRLLVSSSVDAGLRVVISRYKASLTKMIEDLS